MGQYSTRSEFVDFIVPLHERLQLYDPTSRSTHQPKNDATDVTKQIPQGFIDAMTVREEVFVDEQGVPLENELDEDDKRSFCWVVYASIPTKASSPEARAVDSPNSPTDQPRRVSNSTKIPIGTIRLVPSPHPPHPKPGTQHKADALDTKEGKETTAVHDGKEAYIKLGRLAVISEFRKAGVSKLLIETALAFAKEHAHQLVPCVDPAKIESLRQESDRGVGIDWKGLVLVHAQVGVQKVWKRYGFETDESMGTWDEEGIAHVGMWKRLNVEVERRRSSLAWPLA